MKTIQSIRGMNDILPNETPLWQFVEQTIRDILRSYAYHEIRLPVVEFTALFRRTIGEATDIVEKEMYTFADRNGESLTLRPEGTAGCVRACLQHGLLDNQQQQRLWYFGPMFRYEKPQKGRMRQFHQVGVECLGVASADIDAELIAITARLWQRLGIMPYLTLELNTIGSVTARNEYRQALVGFLRSRVDGLDEDSQRRLTSNPLRILDSKSHTTQQILNDAPVLNNFLDDSSRDHFERLKQLLDSMHIEYRINARLVRGLDYYSHTVFEWKTDQLGTQDTVCAGGRYDGLVEQLGGQAIAGTGFALGLERLCLLLTAVGQHPHVGHHPHIYFVVVGDRAAVMGLQAAERLRTHFPKLRVQCHAGGGSFKSQFKRADKSSADIALIVGDNEVKNGTMTLKWLRCHKGQQSVSFADLMLILDQHFT